MYRRAHQLAALGLVAPARAAGQLATRSRAAVALAAGDRLIGDDEDVLGLEIAVHDALGMRRAQRCGPAGSAAAQ
jgi:hypothetical protein